jgi:cyclophilin family peptidyl-prolyl cis-trans isomerase/HEAT repeat protein
MPVDAGVRRDARLLAMLDTRVPDTLLLDSLLLDPDPSRRARAALAIGQGQVKARVPRARVLLVDGDTGVAANAAYALGLARDTGGIEALERAVVGAPDAVAREAAWALGEIGERARPSLLRLLGAGVPWPTTASPAAARAPVIRSAVLLATARLEPAPAREIAPWLRDPAVEVVRAAAYVIGRQALAGGARAAFALRSHPDEEVRQHVARAMTAAAVGDSLRPLARVALRALLQDTSERVRINAARSAATHGPLLIEELTLRLWDPVANVRVTTAEGLGEVYGMDTTRWQRAWDADTTRHVRELLLGHIRRFRVPVALGIEQRWSSHPDWRYRLAAIIGGERTPSDSAGKALATTLATDTNPRVQRQARLRLGDRPNPNPNPNPSTGAAPNPPGPTRPAADYEAIVRELVNRETPIRAVVETERGAITLELFAREAPLVVESFLRLASSGAYGNTVFHRVVPNFVVQDGDITPDGSGRGAFRLRESFTRRRHGRGCLGLATSGPDTGGSQYYFCHSPQPHLDGRYTVFGQVIDGFDAMDRVVQGDRVLAVRIP